MPLETAFFAAAWAAGITEGASILARAKEEEESARSTALSPQLLVPAVLYGSISLPLGLIGASPGPTTIGFLPFSPNVDAIFLWQQQQQNSVLPTMPPQVPVEVAAPVPESNNTPLAAAQTSKKVLRRVDLLRVENRGRQLRSGVSSPVTQTPILRRAAPSNKLAPTRYLATLDGQALPTSLAEAMRRTRFLLLGAGLVTVALSYNQPPDKKRCSEVVITPGRDTAAIRRLVANSKHGAVLRYCDSLPQLLSASSSTKSSFINAMITIPLYSQSTSADVLFWNPGSGPEEWILTPISDDWLMKATGEGALIKQLLVLEADVTPTLSSMEHYFVNYVPVDTIKNKSKKQNVSSPAKICLTNNLSKTMLLFGSLIQIAENNPTLEFAEAVQVVLGCAGKPALPLPKNVVYMDGSIGLGVEVESVLERMYDQAKAELLEAKKVLREERENMYTGLDESKDSESPASRKAELSSMEAPEDDGTSKSSSPIVIVNNTVIAWIDTVGSSIRRTVMWPLDQMKGLQEDYSFWRVQANNRVVHVLSDQRPFVQFLQRSLHADWRIIWYDATEETDVTLFQQREATGIAIVCCSADVTTRAFLMATASKDKELQNQQVLSVVVERQAQEEEAGVTTISIREVHENLFVQVRELLSEGKTVEEVQHIVDLIR